MQMRQKLLYILVLSSLAQVALYAQDAKPQNEWKKDLAGGMNFTQSSFNNWAEGGINTMSLAASLTGKFDHVQGKLKRTHALELAYGQVKSGDLAFRKAVDRIYYQFQLFYENGKKFKPTAVADFRTQFADGFDYTKYDKGAVKEPELKSGFFAPAYFTQTVGYAYDPNPRFSQTLGIGAKETLVNIEALRTAYGVEATKSSRVEAGLTAITKYNRNLMENINWKSQLNVFMSLKAPSKPEAEWAPVTRWDNILSMKVNKFINVNFELSTLYDTNISNDLQLRELLAVGFLYKFY